MKLTNKLGNFIEMTGAVTNRTYLAWANPNYPTNRNGVTSMLKNSSSDYHTHEHEHNRPDPTNSPNSPNSHTDHHNPYHAFGGSDKKNLLHEHPHQHKYVPERENNMEGTDDTDGDEPVTYHFEESWFKNPLDYTELDYTENDVGSSGDLVGSDCYEC